MAEKKYAKKSKSLKKKSLLKRAFTLTKKGGSLYALLPYQARVDLDLNKKHTFMVEIDKERNSITLHFSNRFLQKDMAQLEAILQITPIRRSEIAQILFSEFSNKQRAGPYALTRARSACNMLLIMKPDEYQIKNGYLVWTRAKYDDFALFFMDENKVEENE